MTKKQERREENNVPQRRLQRDPFETAGSPAAALAAVMTATPRRPSPRATGLLISTGSTDSTGRC